MQSALSTETAATLATARALFTKASIWTHFTPYTTANHSFSLSTPSSRHVAHGDGEMEMRRAISCGVGSGAVHGHASRRRSSRDAGDRLLSVQRPGEGELAVFRDSLRKAASSRASTLPSPQDASSDPIGAWTYAMTPDKSSASPDWAHLKVKPATRCNLTPLVAVARCVSASARVASIPERSA